MSGNKSDEDYISESIAINNKIKEAEKEAANVPAESDIASLQAFLDSDFKNKYNDLTREEKKVFWGGLVKAVHLEGKEIKSVELFF